MTTPRTTADPDTQIAESAADLLTQSADQAYAGLRSINHATISPAPLPAPAVYRVLGSLKLIGYALDQACGQLAARLRESLATYDVYNHDGTDPAAAVAKAQHHLAEAGQSAHLATRALEAAQSAIALQGHRGARAGRDGAS